MSTAVSLLAVYERNQICLFILMGEMQSMALTSPGLQGCHYCRKETFCFLSATEAMSPALLLKASDMTAVLWQPVYLDTLFGT